MLGRKTNWRSIHLKAEAHPEEDQMEWMTTGYTQALMKKEYMTYASKRVRSAMAPDTMVQAVAANCTGAQERCQHLLQDRGH